jgi:hypothetical protein
MRVLVATEDGLYAIDGDGRAERLFVGDVGAIARSQRQTYWLVVGGHRLVELRGYESREIDSTNEDLTSVIGTRDDVFVGTVGAHVLRVVDGRLVRSKPFDEIEKRDHWTQPWGAPGDVRSFATDGVSTVFVNVHVGGILRTCDRGETWVPTIDHEIDVHQVARATDGRLFAATGAGGLALSDDVAATWSFVTEGLHGTYLRAVAPVPGGAVVSASTGPFTHSGALYRWYDDARMFERCDRGIPAAFDGNVDSHWIAATDEIVACIGPDATVYCSDDSGVSWRVLASDLSHPRAVFVDRG